MSGKVSLGFKSFKGGVELLAVQYREAFITVGARCHETAAFLVKQFAGGTLLVNVIADPVVEQVELGSHPTAVKAVAQVEVFRQLLFQPGITTFITASGVVEAVREQFLDLRGAFGMGEGQADLVLVGDIPQGRGRTANWHIRLVISTGGRNLV